MNLQTTRVHTAAKKSGLRPLDKTAIAGTKLMLEELQRHPGVQIVDKLDAAKHTLGCKTENGKLRTVVVSPPTYLDWAEPINEAELVNQDNKPDRLLAVIQHLKLMQTLVAHGVKLVIIKPSFECLEGVYTRDIGAVIGDKLIQANMVAAPRKPEELTITGGIKPPAEVQIEGGNIVVDGNLVFLGIGKRTNAVASGWLQSILGNGYEVKPILLKPDVLHLDCAFSPIARPNGMHWGALIYEDAFMNPKDLKLFESVYGRLYHIKGGEYTNLGANTLAIDPEVRIIVDGCETVRNILEKEFHLKVIPVPLSELVKAEGAGRCATLPLLRE